MEHDVQDSRHDWFADVAENFVRYQLACGGFEVYAGSKWSADIAARHPEAGKWFRLEVRSSDRRDKPVKKCAQKLVGLDAVADVVLREGQLNVVVTRLKPDGCRDGDSRLIVSEASELKDWLMRL